MLRRIALLFFIVGLNAQSWAVYHNSSGQQISIYAYDALTSTPATYDAANIAATISLDAATSVSLIDVHPTELGSGIYVFDLATTESNATMLILYAASLTTGVVIEPVTVYTQPTVSEIAIAVAAALAPRTLDSEDYATSATSNGLTTITTVLDVNVVEVDGEAVSPGAEPASSAELLLALDTSSTQIAAIVAAVTEDLPGDIADVQTAVEGIEGISYTSFTLLAMAADLLARTLDTEDYATSDTLTTITTVLATNVEQVDGVPVELSTVFDANILSVGGTTATLASPDDFKADVTGLATSASLAVAQADLDKITGIDGATLATLQPNYAPYTGTPPTAVAIASEVLEDAATSSALLALATQLTTPVAVNMVQVNGEAIDFILPSEIADTVMEDAATSGALAIAQADLDNPTQFQANVSGLATTAQLNARTLPADDYSTSSSIPTIDLSDVATSGAVAAVQVAVEAVEGISPTSYSLLAKSSELETIEGVPYTSYTLLAKAAPLQTVDDFVDDLETRLTSSRAGYLDKLNVSGTLAHSNDAATYKATVSGLATTAQLNARTLELEDYATSATEDVTPTSFSLLAKSADLLARTVESEDYATSEGLTATSFTLLAKSADLLARTVESEDYATSEGLTATSFTLLAKEASLDEIKGVGFGTSSSLTVIRASIGSTSGDGAESVELIIKDSSGITVPNCRVWITTQSNNMSNYIFYGVTNTLGVVTPAPLLDSGGTYYVWRQSATRMFSNPATLEVD